MGKEVRQNQNGASGGSPSIKEGYKGTAPLLRVRDSGVLFRGSEPVVTCAYQPSDSRDSRRQVAISEGGRKLRSPPVRTSELGKDAVA